MQVINWTEQQSERFVELKHQVLSRQHECDMMATLCERSAKSKAKAQGTINIVLIILGALVATNSVAELIMMTQKAPMWVQNMVLALYTIIGLLISILAVLQSQSKIQQIKSLSASYREYSPKFMGDYLEYKFNPNPNEAIAAIEVLIRQQDEILKELRNRAIEIDDLNLSDVNVSYRLESVRQMQN